ncbi:MAG: B-box zinc finger protein [Solirubrobacterales bacterium]
MATCYRHPGRETNVSCSACGRPICPDCMTSTSVGMRCPECARQRTRVRSTAGASGR